MELVSKQAKVLDEHGNVINHLMLHKDADPSEWNAVWDDEHNTLLLSNMVRARRDELLLEVDAVVTNPLRYNDLSQEDKDSLAAKRQALLDVPQQAGFPYDIVWP